MSLARNIKVDDGGVGDGQIATATISIANGSKNLSSTTNLWAAPDQTKAISFTYPTGQGIAFQSVIDTVTDAQHVVLHDAFTGATVSGSSEIVEWGTDDALAFAKFNDWYQSNLSSGLVTLTIPLGRYCFASHATYGAGFGSFRWAAGAGQLLVNGSGNPLSLGSGAVLSSMTALGGFFQLGGRSINNTFVPYTLAARKGDTQVTLVTPADASAFTIGQYAVMTGLDMQPYGFPTNQYYFEHVLVTGKPGGGVIQVAAPLRNNYLTSWPDYNNNSGGPAALFPEWLEWGGDIEFNDITISQDAAGSGASAKNTTLRRVVATGPLGISPTDTVLFQVFDSDFSTSNLEIDKLVEAFAFHNTPINLMHIASASVGLMTIDGCTVSDTVVGIDGTPVIARISNSTIAMFAPGAFSFGRCDETTVTDSVISNWRSLVLGAGDTFGGVGVNRGYTMVDGVIIVPKSVSTTVVADNGAGGTRFTCASTGGLIDGQYSVIQQFDSLGGFLSQNIVPVTLIDATHFDVPLTFNAAAITGNATNGNSGALGWAIPDAHCYWKGQYENSGRFRVLSITADANNTYVQTDQSGGFPAIPLDSGAMHIKVHPAPRLTMRGCTGHPDTVDLSQAPAGAPIYSYSNRSYTSTTLSPVPAAVRMWGRIVSIKINVTTPYTGAITPLTLQAMDFPTLKADKSFFRYSPVIDLRVGGLRTILPDGTVTGGGGGDSNLALPEAVWFTGPEFGGPFISANVSGEALGVTIEIRTDQGIPGRSFVCSFT